jgi:hypothetical protein
MFGNNEPLKNYSAVSELYLDNTPPTTTLTIGSPKYIDGGTTIFDSSTQFTIVGDDGTGSGANPWYRIWDSSGWSAWTPYSGPFTIAGADGLRYIHYNSTDNVGNDELVLNYSTISQLVLDTTDPEPTLTNPIHNAIDVSTLQDVVITFSEKMNTSSFASTCNPDPGGWSWSWGAGDTEATGSHNPFAESTSYTFTITAAEDLIGNSLTGGPAQNPFTFTTLTASASPSIVLTTPANLSTDVPLNQDVVIQFSKQIDTGTFQYTISIQDPGGWTQVWSAGDTVVTLTHNSFALNTMYTFEVTAADDLLGNSLEDGSVPNPWSWTTVSSASPPTIISTTPSDSANFVGINQDVIIEFSKEMNPSTFAFTIVPDPGNWNWVWSAGNTIATGSHNSFATSIQYVFTVTAAEDSFGNALVVGLKPNPWDWTTTSDPTQPSIVSTSPINSEIGVQVGGDIVITFSEAINTATFSYNVAPNPGGWSATWQLGDTVVVLSHDDFDYATVYAFHVTSASDLIGNQLAPGAAENPWYWTTEDAPLTTGTISGRVLNLSAGLLVGASVQLLDGSGAAVDTANTNSTGDFEFTDAPFGTYTISASLDGYEVNNTVTATISPSEPSDDVGDIFLTTSQAALGTVTGTLYDIDGEPIEDANVTLLDSNGQPFRWTSTGEDGKYKFINLPFGDFSLRMSHDDYRTFTSDEFTLDQDNPSMNAMNTLNPSGPIGDEWLIPEWMWWFILIILIIVIIALAAALGLSRRRKAVDELPTYAVKKAPAKKKEPEVEPDEEAEPEGDGRGARCRGGGRTRRG